LNVNGRTVNFAYKAGCDKIKSEELDAVYETGSKQVI